MSNIFPIEIWENICSYLDIKDIINLTNAYPELKNIRYYHHHITNNENINYKYKIPIVDDIFKYNATVHLKYNVDMLQTLDLKNKYQRYALYECYELPNIDPHFINRITHLTFCSPFNQSIDKFNCPNLTHLTFGYKFNQPIDNFNYPNLTHLTFGFKFNQQIDKMKFPKLIELLLV